jgi:Uma2 family endonuclease
MAPTGCPSALYTDHMAASPASEVHTCGPALESGDVLTRDEFERRYALRHDIKKAELIQGVVYVGSPVRIEEHAEPDNLLSTWLGLYSIHHPGVRAGNNGTVRLSEDDEPQPDSMMWYTAGQAAIDSDHYLGGAPELVVEVAASNANIALNRKKESYRLARVQEYVVWLTEDTRFHWFRLRGNDYAELTPGADGFIESEVFPGLRIHPARLLAGDRTAILG